MFDFDHPKSDVPMFFLQMHYFKSNNGVINQNDMPEHLLDHMLKIWETLDVVYQQFSHMLCRFLPSISCFPKSDPCDPTAILTYQRQSQRS